MRKTSQLANRLHPQLLQAGASELLWRRFEVSREVVHDGQKKKSKQSAFKADRNQKSLGISNFRNKWGFPKMVGFPNNPWVFLLKMIILGCEMGVPPFKEAPKYRMHLPTFFFFHNDVGDSESYPLFFSRKKTWGDSCRCATRTASWLHNVESPWDGQQMWRNP